MRLHFPGRPQTNSFRSRQAMRVLTAACRRTALRVYQGCVLADDQTNSLETIACESVCGDCRRRRDRDSSNGKRAVLGVEPDEQLHGQRKYADGHLRYVEQLVVRALAVNLQ